MKKTQKIIKKQTKKKEEINTKNKRQNKKENKKENKRQIKEEKDKKNNSKMPNNKTIKYNQYKDIRPNILSTPTYKKIKCILCIIPKFATIKNLKKTEIKKKNKNKLK